MWVLEQKPFVLKKSLITRKIFLAQTCEETHHYVKRFLMNPLSIAPFSQSYQSNQYAMRLIIYADSKYSQLAKIQVDTYAITFISRVFVDCRMHNKILFQYFYTVHHLNKSLKMCKLNAWSCSSHKSNKC